MTRDINPAAPRWKRWLFLHGPHFMARRLRVLTDSPAGDPAVPCDRCEGTGLTHMGAYTYDGGRLYSDPPCDACGGG